MTIMNIWKYSSCAYPQYFKCYVCAAYAAIYNTDTVDGTANRLVVVLDFGGNKTATNGTFTITFPDPTTPANAIISMS